MLVAGILKHIISQNDKRSTKAEHARGKKRNATVDNIEELKRFKKWLETDSSVTIKEANDLATGARNTGKLLLPSLVTCDAQHKKNLNWIKLPRSIPNWIKKYRS